MTSCDCTGLRENRTPTDRPQVKKVRLGSTGEVMDVETVVTDTEKDNSELLLCQLLDARPDAMPLREGKRDQCYFDSRRNLPVINFDCVMRVGSELIAVNE